MPAAGQRDLQPPLRGWRRRALVQYLGNRGDSGGHSRPGKIRWIAAELPATTPSSRSPSSCPQSNLRCSGACRVNTGLSLDPVRQLQSADLHREYRGVRSPIGIPRCTECVPKRARRWWSSDDRRRRQDLETPSGSFCDATAALLPDGWATVSQRRQLQPALRQLPARRGWRAAFSLTTPTGYAGSPR